jgi:hypothetical protein
MSKKLNEDLMTPVFHGDDLSVNAALQSWTSLIQVFSSVDSSVQDNANRLAILNALSSIIAQKTLTLNHPAQASMAAVTANVTPSPVPSAPVMATSAPPVPSTQDVTPAGADVAPCPCEVEDEEEEKEEVESDEQGKETVNPSSEADAPEVVKVGDEDKDEEEADKDKKAVVDLTIENRLAKLEKKQQMSEATRRMLELAGIRVKL